MRPAGRNGAAVLRPRRLLPLTLLAPRNVEERDRRDLWAMVAPSVLLVLVITIFPLVYSLWVSFHSWEPLLRTHPGNGVDNYRQVLDDPVFRTAVWKTALFVGIVVPVQTLIGLGLALLVEPRRWLRRIFFPIFLLPMLIMPIVVAYMWRMLWESPFGAVNAVASYLAGHHVGVDWLGRPWPAFFAIVATEIWQWTPFMFVVMLAALAAVPPDLREAAEVDRARSLATFWHVVLPAIAPVLTVATIIRVLESANFFATVYGITGGGPGTSTYSLAYYIWNLFHFGRDGAAAAASFLFLAALAVLTGLLVLPLLRRQSSAGT